MLLFENKWTVKEALLFELPFNSLCHFLIQHLYSSFWFLLPFKVFRYWIYIWRLSYSLLIILLKTLSLVDFKYVMSMSCLLCWLFFLLKCYILPRFKIVLSLGRNCNSTRLYGKTCIKIIMRYWKINCIYSFSCFI